MEPLYLIQDFALAFWNSNFAGFLRFLLGVYAVVIVLDIVLLLILRGVGADLVKTMYGADMLPAHRGQIFKRWQKVESQLSSQQETQYKLAILEADAIVDESLALAGLTGDNMTERLEKAMPYQVEHKDRLLWAHSIRNNIIRDGSFSVDNEIAEKVIGIYRDFLKSWEAL